MLLLAVLIVPAACLIGFFATRNAVLGWLNVPFWMVAAAYAYTESTTPATGVWDWYYGLFWAAIACLIACALYAFSIGRKPDEDEDENSDGETPVDEDRKERLSRIRSKGAARRAENRMNRGVR